MASKLPIGNNKASQVIIVVTGAITIVTGITELYNKIVKYSNERKQALIKAQDEHDKEQDGRRHAEVKAQDEHNKQEAELLNLKRLYKI